MNEGMKVITDTALFIHSTESFKKQWFIQEH